LPDLVKPKFGLAIAEWRTIKYLPPIVPTKVSAVTV
jgi:hypothetical protein